MAELKGELVHPLSREEWRVWLAANHTRQEGAWLVTYKKAIGKPRVEYDEAVEEALCFGWVDSKPQKLDEERSLLWFAPRKSGTCWSKPNKERVEQMLAEGKMAPAGPGQNRSRQSRRHMDAARRSRDADRPTRPGRGAGSAAPSSGELRRLSALGKVGHPGMDRTGQTPRNPRRKGSGDGPAAAEGKRANRWRG